MYLKPSSTHIRIKFSWVAQQCLLLKFAQLFLFAIVVTILKIGKLLYQIEENNTKQLTNKQKEYENITQLEVCSPFSFRVIRDALD